MTHTAILPSHIDSTMISCFRTCPRKFYHEFILGLRPAETSIDLHAGSCFATALEAVYTAFHADKLPLEVALSKGRAAFFVSWGDFEIPTWKKTTKTSDHVWLAVEDYFKTYPPITDHIQPYMERNKPTTEYSFSIPLEDGFPLHPVSGDPFLYSGRFDMLGQYQGRPLPRDEKTAGKLESNWAEKWDLRGQFIGYVWACQQGGLDVDSCAVRGVILTKEIQQVEAIKVYSNDLISRWYDQLRRDVRRLAACWREGYFDFNFAESCTMYGNCAFMVPCTSATPENWYQQYVVRRWNPVLKNPIAETL